MLQKTKLKLKKNFQKFIYARCYIINFYFDIMPKNVLNSTFNLLIVVFNLSCQINNNYKLIENSI